MRFDTIKKAKDFLQSPPSEEDETKETKQQEITYVNVLFQAAQLGNSRGGFPSLDDAHYVYKLLLAIKDKYDTKSPDASVSGTSGTVVPPKKRYGKTKEVPPPPEDDTEGIEAEVETESDEEPPAFQERSVKGKNKAR